MGKTNSSEQIPRDSRSPREVRIIGGADGPTAIFTTSVRARRRGLFPEGVGRIISFFRKDAPIPIVINRVTLAVGIVVGLIAPLVVALAVAVFHSNRRGFH